jgi:hypothetical protein
MPHWQRLVAWDILFNNLSTGLFLVTGIAELMRPDIFRTLANLAYPIALALLILDLSLLVMELGDSSRFHHMLRIVKPSSPMSLGTWSLSVFGLCLSAILAMELLAGTSTKLVPLRQALITVALLPSLASAVYKGVLLSTTAQPGWRDARWLGAYLSSAAVLLGCAELLLLSVCMGEGKATAILRPGLVILLLFNLVLGALLLENLWPSLSRAYPSRKMLRLGTFILANAAALPLLLLLLNGPAILMAVAVVLLLLGSLALRFVIISLPHATNNHEF